MLRAQATGTLTLQTSKVDGVVQTVVTVNVTGAAASTDLSVTVNGIEIGPLTTDATGAGTLVAASNPTGTQTQLPVDFPTTGLSGTAVAVGSLTGTLAGSTNPTHGNCGNQAARNLSTTLTDSAGTATGTVTSVVSKVDGVKQTVLTISVAGATASSDLSVLIGGTEVGVLTTDTTGAGTLVLATTPTGTQVQLPADLVLNSGTTVTVGTTITGTLANTETGEDHHGHCTPTTGTTGTTSSASARSFTSSLFSSIAARGRRR